MGIHSLEKQQRFSKGMLWFKGVVEFINLFKSGQ
jgi:hypothetical protein